MFTASELSAQLAAAREAAREARARSVPQSKHWSWLFGNLWNSCRRCRIRLNIPDTILFEQGVAVRWLKTDSDGLLTRGDLSAPGAKLLGKARERNPQELRLRQEFFEAERFRMYILAFGQCYKCTVSLPLDPEMPICVAEYLDGIREELSAAQLEYLSSHPEWRAQVVALQARVCAVSLATGSFNKDTSVDHSSTDVSQLAASLARLAEAAYHAPNHKDEAVEVGKLQVDAALDASGSLWLLRATELIVTFVNRAPAREDAARRAQRQQAERQAEACAKQLKRLLQLAATRGVPFATSFAHFAPSGKANLREKVDLRAMCRGLKALELTPETEDELWAEFLLAKIAPHNEGAFSASDLYAFAGFQNNGHLLLLAGQRQQDQEYELAQVIRSDQEKERQQEIDDQWRARARKLMIRQSADANTSVPDKTTSADLVVEQSSSLARTRTSARLEANHEKKTTPARRIIKKKDDPLGALPGARGKTRRALRELMAAGRRNDRKAEAHGRQPNSMQEHQSNQEEVVATPSTSCEHADESIKVPSKEVVANHPDSFFHAEPGLVLTYRVIRGRPPLAPDSHSNAHPLSQARAAALSERRLTGDFSDVVDPSVASSLIIAVPDLFQTLDTLQTVVEPLLPHVHGQCDALLVGLMGLPNTCWASTEKGDLNNVVHAAALAKLIEHLKIYKELDFQAGSRPVVWLGFGNGACVVAALATSYLASPELDDERPDVDKDEDDEQRQRIRRCLHSATSAVILVNGYFACDGPIRKTLQLLSELFAQSNPPEERIEALVDLHFSAKYLATHGREAVLSEFWKTRHDLSIVDHGASPSLLGLRAMLAGALCHKDVRSRLDRIDVPLILLQSASDRFVPPQRAPEELAENMHDSLRFLPSAAAAIAEGGRTAHVSYLDAGHELLQERTTAVARIIVDILCASQPYMKRGAGIGLTTMKLHGAEAAATGKQVTTNSDHFTEMFATEANEDTPELNVRAVEEVMEDEMCKSNEENGSSKLMQHGTSRDERPQENHRLSERSQKRSSLSTNDTKRSAELRAQQKRALEVKRLRTELSSEFLKSLETKERFRMREEELYSRAAEELVAQAELFESGLQKAKDRVDFLATTRDEEDALQIEDEMKKERGMLKAKMREKNRIEEAEMLKEATTLDNRLVDTPKMPILEHLNTAGSEDMVKVAAAAKRSMEELLESRRRLILALQQCKNLEKDISQYQISLTTMDHDARRLLRTTKLMESNAALRNSLEPQPRELIELRKAHTDKLEEYTHMQDLVKTKTRKLEFANRVAQSVKILVNVTEEAASALRGKLDQYVHKLCEYRGEQRNRKERAELQASEKYAAIKIVLKRLNVLKLEQDRIRGCTQKFVNCDVWNPGYMQRMLTSDLRESLKREHDIHKSKLRELEQKRDDFERDMREANNAQKKFDADARTVSEIHAIVENAFREATRLTIMEELRNLEQEQELAAARVAEEEASEALARRAAASAAGDCTAARVRHKAAADRTSDEKKWVALDVLINPIAYAHVTESEAEQMKFDSDYSPLIRPEDVRRIVALPQQLQLALPFLFTDTEIEAHRLICQFTHDRSEAYFRHIDHIEGTPDESLTSGIENSSLKKSKDNFDGSVFDRHVQSSDAQYGREMLEIILRERRLVRLRAKSRDELTEIEAKYIVIDGILNPWLYNASYGDDTQVLAVPSLAVASIDNNKYNALREAYENGASDKQLGFVSPYKPRQSDGTEHTRESLLALIKNPIADDEVSELLTEFFADERISPRGRRDKGILDDFELKLKELYEREERRRLHHQHALKGESQKASDKKDACRLWGGWDTIHPATTSSERTSRCFESGSYDATKDNPAAFQLRNLPGKPVKASTTFDENGFKEMFFQDLSDLNKFRPSQIKDQKAIYFEYEGSQATLLSEEGHSLETRTSRTHRFEILEEPDRHLLSLTITIVYRGVFTARGYRVGRLAATAFRVPTIKSNFVNPKPIGYAAYEHQQLNTGTTLGRIVIVHKPHSVPLKGGPFQIVIGAASATKYSIKVEAHAVQAVDSKIKDEFSRAKKLQNEIQVCKVATEDMWTSMRLAERKVQVVQALVDEAEVESSRCERETERCNQELILDDERMELTDDQRSELYDEVRTLEVEFAHWCRLFASRSQERRDLLKGLQVLRDTRASKLVDMEKHEKAFKWLQRHLPAAIGLVHGIQPAVDCALALNMTFEYIQTESAKGQWEKLASAKGIVTAAMTPAQDLRRRYRSEGWKTLSLPEQQFAILDETLNPDAYDWKATDKRLKPKKLNRAVRAMKSFTQGELLRIKELPFDLLVRGNETIAWKLLRRFHDDPQQLVNSTKQRAAAYSANLAAATRFKHPKSLSQEEREWVSLDKILNPTHWKGLKLRQRVTGIPYQNVTSKLESEYLAPIDEEAEDASLKKSGLFGSKFGSLVQMTIAKRTLMAAELSRGQHHKDWTCSMDRDHLLRIWSASEDNPNWSIDECKARKLMEKFNGDYQLYAKVEEKKRAGQSERLQNNQFEDRKDYVTRASEMDLDARCRILQAELDRTVNNSNATMTSNVLHGGVGQRFPTNILRLELEAELDNLLREQVFERERAHRFLLEQDDSLSADEASDEDQVNSNKPKVENISKEVYLARKAIMNEMGKDDAIKKLERDLRMLGPKACLACFASECKWKSGIDAAVLEERRKVISDELVFVRMNPQAETLESYVPLSAARGGNPHFRRADLIHQLVWEDNHLNLRQKLNAIDRELHDAFATRKEYMEITSLHTYPTMMWTNNARRALEREHNRYIASIVASDIVDDALAYMFEGWHFGERESNFSVAGYVPSIKRDGFVRAGGDQVLAQHAIEVRAATADENSALLLERAAQGSPRSKQEAVEAESQFRLTNEKVVKAGSEREQHLDFTERTVKFGLFCITLMFFRGMSLIQREKTSWSGAHDVIGGDAGSFRANPTDERKKMRREHQRAEERKRKLELAMTRAKAGAERRRVRLQKERDEAAKKLHAKVRREKQELFACGVLQATYRGHLGRKAAKRWAIKRAELEAINALMTTSAISIQRVYRGYLGRISASVARMEMAEFISMIRLEEATEDEKEYWRTHRLARFKRNARNIAKSAIAKLRISPLVDVDDEIVKKK